MMFNYTSRDDVIHRLVSDEEYRETTESDVGKLLKIDFNRSPNFIRDTTLYREAWELQDSLEDRYIEAAKITVKMAVDMTTEPVKAVPFLSIEGVDYAFTNNSFSQLCERSGMGVTSYMKKCISNGLYHLVPSNLNDWLRSVGNKELLVRFKGNTVVAFLSSKYGIFDHGDALECLSDALGGESRYRIEAQSLGLDNMSVRLVDTEEFLIKDESGGRDKSTAGLIFRNGQTGKSVASVEFLIYTFACTNGLIVAQDRGIVYKRKHISISKEDFTEQITSTIEQFPLYVETAKKDMERARQIVISSKERDKLRNQLKRGLGIGENTVDEIYEVMDTQWDANAWGIAGAITEVAQKFSAERQYQFERYAGELVKQLSA